MKALHLNGNDLSLSDVYEVVYERRPVLLDSDARIAVDRSRVFIGSFNFDPRSARLNTEMGFVIDSPATAVVMADRLARNLPSRAYEVRLSESGALEWLEQRDGREVVHDEEPGATIWRRAAIRVLAALPIEWLL